MSELPEIIIPTLFYILPVTGATYTIAKIFHRQLMEFKRIRARGSKGFGKLSGTFILLIWGCLLSIFLIVAFWFPSFEIPKWIRIAGLILLIPYIICMGTLYGLSRAVAGGASATNILKDFTDIVSSDQKDKKIQ